MLLYSALIDNKLCFVKYNAHYWNCDKTAFKVSDTRIRLISDTKIRCVIK